MKTFTWILLSLFITAKLQAQDVQVTLVDPCSTIDKKSTIIINDNAVTANAQSRPVAETNTVNFTLASSVNTSAGVYNASGNLVRTLWSGVRYDAGNYKAVWSGIMDDGTQAPPGNYQFKVLTNNVQYTWEGVIGNTSTDTFGNYKHTGQGMQDICFVGTKAFYCTGSSEHQTAQKCFLTTDPQKLINVPYTETTQFSEKICTDGNVVYWAGFSANDGQQKNYFVFGTYPADNANSDPSKTVAFASGQTLDNFNSGVGRFHYNSAISLSSNNDAAVISSICVQKSGNLLFVVRAGLNQLQIVDKRPASGAVLQTLTFSNPTAVCCDGNGNLYMVYNGALHKFSVSTAGVLTDLNINFNGITSPGFIDVSPDNSTIAIADNTTNQVKIYSVNGGNQSGILGTGESYVTNPYVADNKFNTINFVKYQPDGSLWVGDLLNRRYQHFNANLTYKENIAFAPNSRSCTIDQNNPQRIFSNFLEYERDYSKPLGGTNGSWKLKANWQGNHSYDDFSGFSNVCTYSNSRSYGTYGAPDGSGEVELTSTGMRPTGNDGSGLAGRDGTRFYPQNINNDFEAVYKSVLTGFTSEGNPIRGPQILFVTTPPGTNNQYGPATGYEKNIGHTNNADRYVFFNAQTMQGNNIDATLSYKLGAIKPNSTTFLWKAAQSTAINYSGPYPINGDFDIGNNGQNKQHSENAKAMVYDHDIFWNAYGEGWRDVEINIWNHVNDDGLLIGHFGITGTENRKAGAAGNAFSTGMAKVGNDYYIVHCDESVQSGVHSWHVSGLNTVAEQTIPLVINTPITIIPDPTSLMVNLPFRSTFTGGSGWIVDQPNTGLTMPTSVGSYRRDSIDLCISGKGTQLVRRDLNNTASLTNWTLSGNMGMQGAYAGDGNNNINNLEVLDKNNKIIARFEVFCNVSAGYHTYLQVNKDIIVAEANFVGDIYYALFWNNFPSFKFTYSNNTLKFKLANYNEVIVMHTLDSDADKSSPRFLRINQKGGGGDNGMVMDLYNLKFAGK